MKVYRSSGLGCLFLALLVLFVLSLVLRLAGFVVFRLLSSPLLLLLVLIFFLMRRKSSQEMPEKKSEIEYEF
ncbi:MAG: hypothetical protein GX079_00350, partial [Tissierellia bacterium]|nr:hypothetical protein [Tissierellia bacterium]